MALAPFFAQQRRASERLAGGLLLAAAVFQLVLFPPDWYLGPRIGFALFGIGSALGTFAMPSALTQRQAAWGFRLGLVFSGAGLVTMALTGPWLLRLAILLLFAGAGISWIRLRRAGRLPG